MSNELNTILKQAYLQYKSDPNPPVPLEAIKEYLKLEGIDLEDAEVEKMKEKRFCVRCFDREAMKGKNICYICNMDVLKNEEDRG